MRRETVIHLNADHSEMCKFDTDSGLFTPIKHHLLRMAKEAVDRDFETKCNEPSSSVITHSNISENPEAHPPTQKVESARRAILEDDTVLHCFASLAFSNQSLRLRQNTSQIIPGTCEWLRMNPLYSDWNQHPDCQLLWLYGSPGCGKTTLLSSVISQLRTDEQIVLYFFCDKSEAESCGNLLAILQSLIFQLVQLESQHREQMLAVLVRAFRVRKFQTDQQKSGFSWQLHDLWSAFTEMLWSIGGDIRVFIIIDALDECDEESRIGRSNISGCFSSLIEDCATSAQLSVKVMLSCRQLEHCISEDYSVSSVWHKALEIKPQMTEADIKIVTQTKVAKFAQAKGISEKLARRLEESFVQNSNGMFLWISLTIAQLRTHRINSEPIDSMFLPIGLNQLYLSVLQDRGTSRLEDLRLVLSCIMCAARPLKISELHCMLECHSGDKWEGLKGDISFLCGPLVVIYDGDVLRMVHNSVRTFLTSAESSLHPSGSEKKPFIDVTSAETVMASACLSYLETHCDRVPSRKVNYRIRMEALLEKLPFMEYAYLYWNRHLRNAGPDGINVQHLLEQAELIETMFQVSYFLRFPLSRDDPWFPDDPSSLNFAASFDILWLVKYILDRDDNPDGFRTNDQSWTPLIWAAEKGNPDCVDELLRRGADPNTQVNEGWTALHWVAIIGGVAAAKHLLDNGANVLLKDNRGHDAEQYAAKAGNWEVVSLLRRKLQELVRLGVTKYDSHSGSDSDLMESAVRPLSRPKVESAVSKTEAIRDPPIPTSGLELEVSEQQPEATGQSQDIIIAVMGVTGSGKSSLISTLVGGDRGLVGHGLASCKLMNFLVTILRFVLKILRH